MQRKATIDDLAAARAKRESHPAGYHLGSGGIKPSRQLLACGVSQHQICIYLTHQLSKKCAG